VNLAGAAPSASVTTTLDVIDAMTVCCRCGDSTAQPIRVSIRQRSTPGAAWNDRANITAPDDYG
jgi:hypothetical protein